MYAIELHKPRKDFEIPLRKIRIRKTEAETIAFIEALVFEEMHGRKPTIEEFFCLSPAITELATYIFETVVSKTTFQY